MVLYSNVDSRLSLKDYGNPWNGAESLGFPDEQSAAWEIQKVQFPSRNKRCMFPPQGYPR